MPGVTHRAAPNHHQGQADSRSPAGNRIRAFLTWALAQPVAPALVLSKSCSYYEVYTC